MSIVPWDSGADDDERSLSHEFFHHHNQLFHHLFNFSPFSNLPFPSISPVRTLPYSELEIETDGAFNSRLQCNEIPEAYLLVANLPPAVEKNQVVVQTDDGDGAPALRISGEGGWGRFNWRMKLPPNARLDQLGSSVENGVLTVVIPKVGLWGSAGQLPAPAQRNVRVVEIAGSDD